MWDFIKQHINDDPNKLRLKYHGKDEPFEIDSAITQIDCRRRFGKKLSGTLARNPHFIFPSVISGEQATSDLLAHYHADLVGKGRSIVDLTAGLGIDALHFLYNGCDVTAVEIEQAKAEALILNSHDKIGVTHGDCVDVIDTMLGRVTHYDVAFIDPARRGAEGQRVFALADCQPDVIALLPKLRRLCNTLIVKVSPMLDITHLSQSLPEAAKIIALGTPTECKELVAVCQFAQVSDLTIQAITLCPEVIEFAFLPQMEKEAKATYSMPRDGGYIYEPYPTVMKAAPFDLLSQRYGIDKLNPNTHLYWSTQRVDQFPGQCLPIVKVLPYASKHIKRLHREYPALQVAVRNFDISADALRKKLGVRDGNDYRLFGTTLSNNTPALIVCKS